MPHRKPLVSHRHPSSSSASEPFVPTDKIVFLISMKCTKVLIFIIVSCLAFTNAAAIESLKNTIKAADILNEPINPKWVEVSNKLKIHSENGITQNYKGYKGQTTKQADVNLLAYPLHVVNDEKQIKADLDYYAAKIDSKDGPAMTDGVLSVLYTRLGD